MLKKSTINNPTISVFTTCLNSGVYLEETLESVLYQDFQDFEIIIIDAGSTDHTLEILKGYNHDSRIKFYVKPGININDGFIEAFRNTSGKYVMCLPISDCYHTRSWFSKCVKIFDDDINISLVHAISIHQDDTGDKFFGSGTRNQCPSEVDFLPFWLSTYYLQSEHTYCVRRNIYEECLFKTLPDKYIHDFDLAFNEHEKKINNFFWNFCYTFVYNFNSLGYLSKFIPSIVGLVRANPDQMSNTARKKIDIITGDIYCKMVSDYRYMLFSRKISHVFKNGKQEIISKLQGGEFDNFIYKTINYRIQDRLYFNQESHDYLRRIYRNSVLIVYNYSKKLFKIFIYLFISKFKINKYF